MESKEQQRILSYMKLYKRGRVIKTNVNNISFIPSNIVFGKKEKNQWQGTAEVGFLPK